VLFSGLFFEFVPAWGFGGVMEGGNTYRLPDGRGPRIGAPFASLLFLLSKRVSNVQMLQTSVMMGKVERKKGNRRNSHHTPMPRDDA
jgi:hypothetical protein